MINKKLSLVPHQPGCYLMKDKNGIIIYVGKSKNLKNRLTSYFKSKHTGKTAMLVRDIVDFEYILTSSELEALLLEINLIKKHDPKYNILLRDDKTYPYIEVTNEKVFRLLVVRNPNMKKSRNTKLFGPLPNVTAARRVVEMINRIYPLRKCRTYEKKECLYYHINECLGYCTKQINEEKMKEMRSEIISFLNGNHTIITNKLKQLMEEASNKLQFERALEYKELLDYITVTLEKQKVELDDNYDRDIIGFETKNGYLSITFLFIRGGKLLDKKQEIINKYQQLFNNVTNLLNNWEIDDTSNKLTLKTNSDSSNEILITDLRDYYKNLPTIVRYASAPIADAYIDDYNNDYFDWQYYTMLPLDEEIFEINANTRKITEPTSLKNIGVAGDAYVETVFFKIHRYFDTVDFASTDLVPYIEWKRGSKEDISPAYAIEFVRDTDYILIGWTLTQEILEEPGVLEFALRFISESPDNEILYSYSTLPAKVNIVNSLNQY